MANYKSIGRMLTKVYTSSHEFQEHFGSKNLKEFTKQKRGRTLQVEEGRQTKV